MGRKRWPTWEDCTLEDELSCGVCLYNASDLMPRIESKREFRPVESIDRMFFHHSGALGRPGLAGALASANYVVKLRKNSKGKPARFPGPAYTFWIPAAPVFDKDGDRCVFRLNEDNERSWHTGGEANDLGVAAVFQGNTTSKPLTDNHSICAGALTSWAIERYSLSVPEGIGWHSVAGKMGGRSKAKCPGKGAEAWLRGFLRGYVAP